MVSNGTNRRRIIITDRVQGEASTVEKVLLWSHNPEPKTHLPSRFFRALKS